MYRSQIADLLLMLEECDNSADYRDLRRIVNRFVNKLNKWPSPSKKQYPWDNDTNFDDNCRNAGLALWNDLIKAHGSVKSLGGSFSHKIPLIKDLRGRGGEHYDSMYGGMKSNIDLRTAKEFVEKYFSAWC